MSGALEHWQAAGEMVIEKRASSSEKSRQYKDSVLWHALLEAGQSQTMILVTQDKGFLSVTRGDLDPSLQEEGHQVGV
jgi:hypothetical protein